jgi:hypothetical protein
MSNIGQSHHFLRALFYRAWKAKILDIFERSVSDSLLTFSPNFHIPKDNMILLSWRSIHNFLLGYIPYTE